MMPTILAIDDRQDNLLSLSALLKSTISRCKVLTALSGKKGIEMAKHERPDTILLDIHMPGMDGFETCRAFKSDPASKHIPVIMLTAVNTDSDSRVRGLEIGADAFLTKPIDRFELAAQVKAMLRIKYAEDSMRSESELLENKVAERTEELLKQREQLIREITVRKQTEAALKEREERYKLLFNSGSDAVFVYPISDQEPGVFTEVNDVACYWLGYSREELLTMTPRMIDAEGMDAVRRRALKKMAETGRCIFEMVYAAKSKERVHVEVSSRVFESKGKNYVLSVARDISERRQMEARLQQAQKMEAVGTLAGGIAHDFNNMLGIIIGNLSHALSNLKQDQNDELFEILWDVQQAANQAKSLTQQLLTFAKGGAPVKKTADLNLLIKESVKFVLRGEKSNCVFDLADDLWRVEIDSGQINQTIGNLTINAVQAMPDGGNITVGTRNLDIETENDLPLTPGKYVKIIVSDQGVGISEKHISKIFDPYFTTKQKGSGLGLATTYSIIKKHGGHIGAESRLGGGTSFHVYLPASEKDFLPAEEDQEMDAKGRGRVLVMDDQPAVLRMVGRMLEKIGYEPSFADDGRKAIEMYREKFQSPAPFDLVILDLTVPGGMGGAKTIPELLKIDPKVKAVVCSGYSNDPIMANYRDYGFSGVVPKPYSKSQLAEVLDRLLTKGGKKLEKSVKA